MQHLPQDMVLGRQGVGHGIGAVDVEGGHFAADRFLLSKDEQLLGADHLPGGEIQVAALLDLLDHESLLPWPSS